MRNFLRDSKAPDFAEKHPELAAKYEQHKIKVAKKDEEKKKSV